MNRNLSPIGYITTLVYVALEMFCSMWAYIDELAGLTVLVLLVTMLVWLALLFGGAL